MREQYGKVFVFGGESAQSAQSAQPNHFFMAAVAGALLSGFPVPALAQDPASMCCDELWRARNQIYKDEHFCFKTERAQRFFGNEGCIEPFPGLRHWEQERVNELQMWESGKGC